MVRTVGRYDPPIALNTDVQSLINFNMRIMTRTGESVVDFGEFKDLLSYNDSLSVESPAGSWNLKMRATLDNETLLKKIHPGFVVEIYAARNADPLESVGPFEPQSDNPPVFTLAENAGTDLDPTYAPVEGVPAPPPGPDHEDYLDAAPYLLMRGVTTSYGRSSSVVSGAGGETTLTLSGESYGRVYRDAQVLVDADAPTSLGKALEIRFQSQNVNSVVPLYYGVLRHWVEQFWGEETGWEARTRPIPVPPDTFARLGSEGSVWSSLNYLNLEGLFQIFVDHTGALCWEKLPYSGKCQTVVDTEYLKWGDSPLRNWEDLPILEIPSWMLISWADRLSCDRIANYVRCNLQGQMGAGGSSTNMNAGQCFNMGSIRQYGGPKKLEISIPARLTRTEQNPEADQEREARISTFMDLVALEVIRWYDRPVQRIVLTVRGDAAWRINTRVAVAETWHQPDADPAEYLVLSRSHSINVAAGSWTTQIDAVRDRRNRYLGAGLTVQPGQVGQAAAVEPTAWTDGQTNRAAGHVSSKEEIENYQAPIEPDEYWWFDRKGEQAISLVGDDAAYTELIAPYMPEDCEIEEQTEAQTDDGFADGGIS